MTRFPHIPRALVLVTAILCAAALVNAEPETTADPRIVRGKYLVTLMACDNCHSPGAYYGVRDPDRFLAGSDLGWVGPWGVAYAGNLTPDSATGVGKWTAAQLAMAVRSGNRPDGRQLAPAMPWPNFATLTDADALAIGVYLKTLKPLEHTVPRPAEPGVAVKGPALAFPSPSAWDAPHPTPPPGK